MKTTSHSSQFKAKEIEKVQKYLTAFENNFHEIILHKYDHGSVEVYLNEEAVAKGEYVQYCENLDYFNGWLNGAVQANNHRFN